MSTLDSRMKDLEAENEALKRERAMLVEAFELVSAELDVGAIDTAMRICMKINSAINEQQSQQWLAEKMVEVLQKCLDEYRRFPHDGMIRIVEAELSELRLAASKRKGQV